MNKLIETAFEYKNRGFNPVPLLKEMKKPPMGFDFDHYFTMPMTEDEIKEWFSKSEVGNIGIILGKISGLIGVDIDDPSLVQETLQKYPTDMAVKTAGGGCHLYFKYPDDVTLPSKEINGLEIYTGSRLFVAPPSFAISEHNGIKKSGNYEWIKNGNPLPLPYSLMILMLGTNGSSSRTGKYTRNEVMDMLNYAIEHKQFIPKQHDDTVYYGSLIRAGDGISIDETKQLMLELDKNDPTPIGSHAVISSVERAYKISEEKNQLIQVHFNENNFNGTTSTQFRQPIKKSYESYDERRERLWGYEPKWLIDDWVFDEAVTLIAAPPQRFKTWLCADMAWSVVTGNDFLGQYPVNRSGNVLIIQQEDAENKLQDRYDRINLAYSNMNEPEVKENGSEYILNFNRNLDNQVYFTRQDLYNFNFKDENSIKELEQIIVETKAVMVIIDPLYSTNGDTEKYFSDMGNQIIKSLKPIRQRTGCTFILVHHTTKSGDTLDVNKVWGSQIMLAAFESKIILAMENAEKPTEISIGRNYKDTGNLDVIKLKFNIDRHSFAYSVNVSEANKEDKRSFMLITYLSEHGPTKYGDLRKEFDEKFEMSSGSQLSSFMKKRPEIFVSQGNGNWSLTPDYLKGKKNEHN